MFLRSIIKRCDVPRNLDLTALRSFVTVAETGGVTRAAGFLNLTQSAVSMQLKRLEDALGLQLLDRSARAISLTASGEQMLSYAKRMLDLNDEAWGRLTSQEFEGEITIGVPHDIIYPYIPPLLRRLATDFPRIRCKLISEASRNLREMYGRGECDAIITTEDAPGPGGQALVELPLVWIGAASGVSWRRSPLPVAFCSNCIFRTSTLRRLDQEDMDWEMVVESAQDSAVEAAVSADLAITVAVDGQRPGLTEPVDHNGALPDAGSTRIILYMEQSEDPVKVALRELIRVAYQGGRDNSALRLTA